VVGDEAQRVRVHDTPHPQASTFHGWDEEEEKNMDSISINSNHSMEKDSKAYFLPFFFIFFLRKVFLASLKGEKTQVCRFCVGEKNIFSFIFFFFFLKFFEIKKKN
jgi:hypothetical protein